MFCIKSVSCFSSPTHSKDFPEVLPRTTRDVFMFFSLVKSDFLNFFTWHIWPPFLYINPPCYSAHLGISKSFLAAKGLASFSWLMPINDSPGSVQIYNSVFGIDKYSAHDVASHRKEVFETFFFSGLTRGWYVLFDFSFRSEVLEKKFLKSEI